MHVLIIGGTGFMGPRVVRLLHEQGHAVAVFHRGKTEADLPEDVQHIHCGDVSDGIELIEWRTQLLPKYKNEFGHFAPDVVLDMTPIGEQDAQAVVNTCREVTPRLVAISSCDVYRAYGRLLRTEPGPPDPVPLTEDSPLREKLYPYREETRRGQDDPLRVRDFYEKILVEQIVMNTSQLAGTILRLPAVYGPDDVQHRLFEFLKRMDDKRPVILFDEVSAPWGWTRGYVENVAWAIVLAVTNERAAGRIYNVGEPKALSLEEWVQAIGKAADWNGEVVVTKESMPSYLGMDAEGLHQDLVCDSTRIRTELGYKERISFEEGLQHTVAWERANPPKEIDPKQFDYDAEDAVLAKLGKH